ncbi:MAG: T9SS type A sorting domain-containing protein [Bacteroidetes bacterium]|nr:T9SS type A sorting domain-containing protein [Bacteroidota bacterium]MBS1629571.1 T9SS type A sorting domain-containing protein [Bacteroidota bacterium]
MKKLCSLLALIATPIFMTMPAHAQTITITSVSPAGPYCSGSTATVTYTVTSPSTFSTNQDFKVEISDASGTYAATPPVIGSRNNADDGGSINVTMPTVSSSGTGYTIQVTAYKHGAGTLTATSASSASFTINPIPNPTLTPSTTNSCKDGNVTYTTEASMSSYVWGFGAFVLGTDYTLVSGGTSGSNTAVVQWLTTGSNSISINYTSNGCTSPSPTSSVVTVHSLPTVTFSPAAPTDACIGTAVTYSTQSGNSNYMWLVPGSTLGTDYTLTGGGTSDNSATITWLTSGSKTVSVNYQNGNGCGAASATSANTTVHTLPVASFTTAPAAPVCPNVATTYTTQSGAAAGSYVWTIPGTQGTDYTKTGGGTNDQTATITWLTSGSKTVEVNYEDANGCSSSANASNTVLVNQVVSTPDFGVLGTSSARCQAAGTLSYPASAAHSTSITYSLDGPSITGGNSINAATGDVTYLSTWNGTSIITASAAGCGGPKTATHTVTNNPLVGTPSFTLGATSTRCQGAGNITYTASATNSTGLSYSLDATSTTAGNSINSSNGKVTYTSGYSGTSVITVNAAGCTPQSATHTVTIVGNPVFALGATSTRCQAFGTVTYTATATNATGISYTLDATSTTAGNVINSATGQVTYSNTYNGNSTITATATGCGTNLTSNHAVTINPSVGPVSFVGASSTACQGSSVTYTANASNASSITYSLDLPSISAGNTINSTTGLVHYANSFTGTSYITATATGCGVVTTAVQTVVITPIVTQPIFNVGPLDTICQNPGNITYTASAANTIAPMGYSLSPGAAGSIGSLSGVLSYNSSYTGAVTITATATGCNGTSTNDFHVFVRPTVAAPVFGAGSITLRKQGSGVNTFSATAANASSIIYSMTPASAGNIVSNSGDVTWNPTFSGNDTITATAFGCNATPTTKHIVTVVQTPIFFLGSTSTRCQGSGNVVYTANSSNGAVSYSLITIPNNPGTTINSSTGLVSYSSSFFGTAIISAIATNGAVTTDTAQHIVTVNKAPELTAPTPTAKTICSGDSTRIALVATSGAGSSFTYVTAGGAYITGKSGGVLSYINQALVNSSNANPDSFYYIVTVTSASFCPSLVPDSILVRVNPKPVLTALLPRTICSKDTVNFSLSASAPSTFIYTERHDANIRNAFGSGGSSINQMLENTDSSSSPLTGAVVYSIVPTSLVGCVGNADSVTVTVKPAPRVIFSTGAAVARCSGTSSAISLSANVPSTFTWTTATITSKGFVSGNSGGSGSNINQTLVNSSNALSDSITYTVTPTTVSSSPTCVGPQSTVVVTVNPKPVLTSILTDSVCSNSSTSTPLSASLPSTYAWSLGTNTGGITGASALSISTALSTISQKLVNPSFVNAGSIEYIVTPTSTVLGNCAGNPSTVTITVNPQPKLTSPATASVCSDTRLLYLPTSSVATGTTVFTYDRTSQVPSIPNQFQKTTTGINDSLSSHYQLDPSNVDYNFTLKTDAGCVLGNQHLTVTVNPTPDTPGIAIFPLTKLCNGATDMNFSTSRMPDPREYFIWNSVNAGIPIQKADSTASQNALISFPSAGNANVVVTSMSRGFGCKGKPSVKGFNVSNAIGAQGINVVLFANNLVAQVSSAEAFQWGFERKLDLDSSLIIGATTQSYDTRNGFNTDANNYWVMVRFGDGCVQKGYFNAPVLSVIQQNNSEGNEMKVYPNPVQEILSVELLSKTQGTLRYKICDITGRSLLETTNSEKQTQINVRNLAPGAYSIICLKDGQRIATARFIKN